MIIGTGKGKTATFPEVDLEDGSNHKQPCITFIALHIEIAQIVYLKLRLLITYPCKDTEILDMQIETPPVAKLQVRLRLNTESAAHVVVTLQHIKVVAFGTT